ncbi:MAG: HAD family hydrolase [Ilumatobacteraceae bacterium]
MPRFDVLAFDADDTLWHSEDGFRAAERRFHALLGPFAAPGVDVADALVAMERANLSVYGYGVKAFGLSMIEAALTVSQGKVTSDVIAEIIDIVRDLLLAPVRLLPDVAETLHALRGVARLMIITKGDLVHQTRKVTTSGLEHHFDHVEVVLEKDLETYRRVMREAEVTPDRFCMVGNSVRSDVLPVLELGGHAVHVPYPFLWEVERVEVLPSGPRFAELGQLSDLPGWLSGKM